MNKKLLFCAFVIFSFIAVSTKPILASSIQNLPGFSEIQVVFYDGGNHFLLELTKAELVDNPNSNLVMGTIYGKDVLGGLSGSNGALGNGDDHFVLSLSPRITGGYWLESVALYFSNGTYEYPTKITATGGLEFVNGYSINDLSKVFGPPTGRNDGMVGIVQGAMVFEFKSTASPVPIPTAFWFLGSGLISLIGFKYKYSKKTSKNNC